MNLNTVAALIDDSITTAKCIFLESGGKDKKYTFKTFKCDAYAVGDTVVVETQYGLTLAVIAEVDEESDLDINANYDYCWIISKVDIEKLKANKAAEQEKVAELRKEQRKRLRQQIIESFKNSKLLITN